jgi:hypothetical protein
MFTLWTNKNKVVVRISTVTTGMPGYHEIYRMPGFKFVAGVCKIGNIIYLDGKRYIPNKG